MYIKEFPDIHWLQKKAQNDFKDQRGINDQILKNVGWPNVILNTQSGHVERDNIKGPFSIFLNLSGESMVKTDKEFLPVRTDFYFISNKEQTYHLHIPKDSTAHTFNIHFGAELYRDVVYSLQTKEDRLLDSGPHNYDLDIELLPKLHWKSKELSNKIQRIKSLYDIENNLSKDLEYELLSDLLQNVLIQCGESFTQIDRIDTAKKATKTELFRRINLAEDYLNEYAFDTISLEELSKCSSLSKFHLLRTFKKVKGQTPMEYVSQLRLKKAKQLLLNSDLQASQIATSLGFSELPAFTKFFKRNTELSPTQFRKNSNLG